MSTSPILGIGQKQQNYFIPAVEPLQPTNMTLPGGGPGQGSYYYSLSVQSTVPFVTLTGGGSSKKDFSWGELIEVKEGQQVTVQSASFMKGDIEISSGLDYSAKPERISVAVEMIGDMNSPGTQVFTAFPADTRRCRQAYFVMNLKTPAEQMLMAVRGYQQKHTLTGDIDGLAPLPFYITGYDLPPLTLGFQVPLGYGSGLIPNTPMALLDAVEVFFITPSIPFDIPAFPLFMYVLEY